MTLNYRPPRVHVLATPTGAICNLACRYCFFRSKDALYPESDFNMSEECWRPISDSLSRLTALCGQPSRSRAGSLHLWKLTFTGLHRATEKYYRPDFPATFQDFPPRQKAAGFTRDQVIEKFQEAISSP
jgi:hypothetical protein